MDRMELGSGVDEVGGLAVDYDVAEPRVNPRPAAAGAAVDEEMEMPWTPEADVLGSGSLLTDLARGAVAGAVGTWAMDKVTQWMWNREDADALEREMEARPGGLDPAHAIANRVAGAMGKELSPRQPHPAGVGVHYALGILPGAVYGALRNRVGGVDALGGLLYGLGLFVFEDEGANALLGTSGKPTEYPWQAHVRGLVGHMVLGVATHATLEMMEFIEERAYA
jgi:hypothetical protein